MRDISSELIFDLARLLRKYPPETWAVLAGALRDPRFVDRLAYFAARMDSISRHLFEAGSAPLVGRSHRAEEDLERALLFKQLRSDLARKPVAQLRDVAFSLGLRPGENDKKVELVGRILQTFQDLPSGELKRRLPKHLMHSSKSADEYERWVSLIMGKSSK